MSSEEALVIFGKSMQNMDLLYATGYGSLDESAFVQVKGKSYLIVYAFEEALARKKTKTDKVVTFEHYNNLLRKQERTIRDADQLDVLLQEHDVKNLVMPRTSDVGLVDELRELGYNVRYNVAAQPFIQERRCKTDDEIAKITEVQRVNEYAMDAAIDAIRKSRRGDDGLLYKADGQALTSEDVRLAIDSTLISHNCVSGMPPIVACGDDTVFIHEIGHGPLRANKTIVIDIFPYSREHHYYADMSRTIVRGKASSQVKRMYEVVQEGKSRAMAKAIHDQSLWELNNETKEFFTSAGFKTTESEGFFQGLGHGVGLEIHEAPSFEVLQKGDVITIEPGLYYRGIGGMRLEDMVVVQDGEPPINLTEYPEFLEI